MLKIINTLRLFFEDCYRRINVREYSRVMRISAPTASKILFEMNKGGLLKMEKDRNYIFFYANKENRDFVELLRIYWRGKLREVIDYLEKDITSPTIILFGSVAKAETREDSDIDIAVFGHKKNLDLSTFEKRLKRKIQIFWFSSIKKVNNKELVNNIINGHILSGRLKI